jgi:diguanylate cyclase (GGDEF)-like protein
MQTLRLPTKRVSPLAMLAVALPSVALVGVIDHLTGPVAMSLLYYVPIVAVAWLSGLWPGVLVAASAGSSLLAVAILQAAHATPIIYWNSFTRAVTFAALGVAVSLLRKDRDKLHDLNERLQASLRTEAGLARTDALTGLPNGRSFREQLAHELARSQRDGTPIAVGYLDLDNFKRINDGFGHDAGDAVLRRAAAALSECVRDVDLAARIGGDEFVVALVSPGERACEMVGERILDKMRAIAREFPEAGFGATIGFAWFEKPPADVEVLLKQADDVMYDVKATGKGRFAVVRR